MATRRSVSFVVGAYPVLLRRSIESAVRVFARGRPPGGSFALVARYAALRHRYPRRRVHRAMLES